MSSAYFKNYRVVESLALTSDNRPCTQIAVFVDCASSNTLPLDFRPLCIGIGEGSLWSRTIPPQTYALAADADGGCVRSATGRKLTARGFVAKLKAAPIESRDLTAEERELVASWKRWQPKSLALEMEPA